MDTATRDTTPEAERRQMELIRGMPAWRRVQLASALTSLTLRLALSGLRRRHPIASERELRRRLADMTLGPELAAKAYGPLSTYTRTK